MNTTNQQNTAKAKTECEPQGASLLELHQKIDQLAKQAENAGNPFVKAKFAIDGVKISQQITKELIIKIEQLEKLNGVM